MIVRETVCLDKIKRIFGDPEIYDRIADDYAPPLEEFEPAPPCEGLYYVTDESNIGLVFYHWKNGITLEGHIQVLKEFRHLAMDFGQAALDWAWNNTEAKKIIAVVPTLYPDVIKFVEKFGFEREGETKRSYEKNGVLYNQVYLGISR